ncbi:MAG: glycosyltransferase [Candidatus Hydrogenedentes bacterium]|nr:glycosyltransferase [Candidatus Hydrogenedentota bacterium]
MSVVVVVPTYNERDNIVILIDTVLEHLPDARILVVDDNSPDGTGQVADELAAKMPDRVSVLHRNQKQGLGAAYVAGYRYAMEQFPDAALFVQMDADLSHDPAYLPALVETASTDADVAVGSRYHEQTNERRHG